MKNELIKKSGLVGAGIGIALFAVFGLLQGALIGGAAGLATARYIFGETTLKLMANELLPRIIVAASMLAGVLFSGITFVVTFGIAGAVAGYVLSTMTTPVHEGDLAHATAKKNN